MVNLVINLVRKLLLYMRLTYFDDQIGWETKEYIVKLDCLQETTKK